MSTTEHSSPWPFREGESGRPLTGIGFEPSSGYPGDIGLVFERGSSHMNVRLTPADWDFLRDVVEGKTRRGGEAGDQGLGSG